MKDSLLERFLRYVRIDTQSDPFSEQVPSTAKQLDLSRLLMEELEELGVEDVRLGDGAAVYARLPGNLSSERAERVPTIGFLAHVDTSPDVSGTNVNPIVHRNYAGGDLVLNERLGRVLREAENPRLTEFKGCDIITTDGTTLLGADDKAGVAAIMDMLDRLVHDDGVPRGDIAISFTTDEEVGGGAENFDVKGFGAKYAYTVDGGPLGEIDVETFNAHTAIIEFEGVGIHPGSAYKRLVNAGAVAADFVSRIPRGIRPEESRDRDGYIHPHTIEGTVDKATIRSLVRDFDERGSTEKIDLLHRLARESEKDFPGSKVTIEIRETYRNMAQILEREPKIVDLALQATRRSGLEPRRTIVRGGTDGALLSFMGLPCPNIFTSGENYHSYLEWIPLQGLEKTVETLLNLVRLWTEES